jgi:hypothetical protein
MCPAEKMPKENAGKDERVWGAKGLPLPARNRLLSARELVLSHRTQKTAQMSGLCAENHLKEVLPGELICRLGGVLLLPVRN